VSNDGANFSFSAARFNVDGSLDTSFDGDGKVIVTSEGLGDLTRGMAVQPDERIVMVGVSRPDYNAAYGLVRWNSDGSLDTSFDSDGKVSASINFAYDFAASVVLQPDGRILASGTSLDDFSVLRLNPNGSLDTSYGIDGKMTVNWIGSSEQAFASTLQSDGRLLIAGVSRIGNNSDFSVVRLNTDGTLDTSFDRDGKLSISMGSDNDIARSIVLQSDGRIILAGSCTNGGKNSFALVRLNTDGSLDTSFGNGGKLIVPVGSGDSEAYGVNVQPDGKIVVVGRSSVSGNWDASILRLNTDGTLDTNFADAGKRILPLGTGNDLASSVSVQPDGRIVIAGNAGGDNSTSRYCVIRLNSEGSLDTTFNGSTSNTLGGSVSTLENIPIVLDQDVQIFDADLSRTNFAGAKLTLTHDGGSNPEDLFSATGSLGALTQGGNLVVDGKTIGTVTTNSSGTLVLTFNTSATNALVNSAMQQITYSNSSDTPPSNVTIVWTFSDGNNGSQGSGAPLTAVGSVTVNITPVNDPPVARPDSYRMRSGSTKLLDVLANDYDTDGPIYGLQFVEFNFPPVFASATKFDGKVRFQINDPTFEGKLSFRYVAFDYQLSSNIVEVSIDISDFPYQNPSNPFNVDNDSSVSPLDVLAIINLLNSKGPAIFVDDLSGVTDYVDVNGDNRVDPLDVLAVINHINTGGNNRMGGEGEGGELAGEGWPMPPLRDGYSGTPMVNIPGIERSSEAESRKSPARMLHSEAGPIRGNFSVLNPGLAERVFEREQWNIEQPEPEWDDSVQDTDLIDLAFQKLIPRSECAKWAL
jgi:uncharacterized delta-60 repeat protein